MGNSLPDIDPKALYTIDQAAKFLMDVEPELTADQARKQIMEAIKSGKLRVAGYLHPSGK